ncbi:MAG: hypothetical protein AAFR35_01410 [Pseudomonadota bacterium]
MQGRAAALTLILALGACATTPTEPVSQDVADAECIREAESRGVPEADAPFGPDGFRARVGLPPYDALASGRDRRNIYVTCFHRLTGELPGDIPPLG